MTYLVTVQRIDTGATLTVSRHDGLAAALAAKRDAFRRHHHYDVGDIPVPYDRDFDDFDTLDRLCHGRPLHPLAVAVTISPQRGGHP